MSGFAQSALSEVTMNLRHVLAWYTNSNPANHDVLIAVAATCAMVWAGGLISFSLQHRYSTELRFGLDYLAQAFYMPLASMALPGLLFRLLAAWFFVGNAVAATLQLRVQCLLRNLIPGKHVNLTFKVSGDADIDEETRRKATGMVEDHFNTVIHGGRYSLVAAMAFAVAMLAPYPRLLASVYVALLLYGFVLVFGEITKPLVPRPTTPRRVDVKKLTQLLFLPRTKLMETWKRATTDAATAAREAVPPKQNGDTKSA